MRINLNSDIVVLYKFEYNVSNFFCECMRIKEGKGERRIEERKKQTHYSSPFVFVPQINE